MCDWPVHLDDVFLLVLVLGTQDLVDDVAIVGQQDQPLRVLVEPPDREDTLPVPDEIDDVAADLTFRGAGYADRLVEREIDMALWCPDQPAIDADLVALPGTR